MSVKPTATIYTDGACQGNPGPGGWACVVLIGDSEQKLAGGDAHTTNNRMELMGVINGLKALRGSHIVTVYSDSQYVTNAFNKGWLRSWKANGWTRNGDELKNSELWKELDALVRAHSVQFIWVKGHNGNYYNEMCDKMATQKSAQYARGEGFSQEPELQEDGQQQAGAEPDVANVLDVFEQFIRTQNQMSIGVPSPCGAMNYCDFCTDADPAHRCAMAYMAWTKTQE